MTTTTVEITAKEAAQLLTAEGFIRWTEGKKLRNQDFKQLHG